MCVALVYIRIIQHIFVFNYLFLLSPIHLLPARNTARPPLWLLAVYWKLHCLIFRRSRTTTAYRLVLSQCNKEKLPPLESKFATHMLRDSQYD